MRLEDCEQIWHGFGVLHRHLLLMIILIALWHSVTKKGSTYEMFLAYLYLFLFLGGEFIFDWLELVELFRLYLGASLCTLSF